MLFDLNDILNSDAGKLEIDAKVFLENSDFGGSSYAFPEPVRVVGVAENLGGVIEINVRILGKVITPCAKCNKQTTVELNIPFIENLQKDGANETELIGTCIDLTRLAEDSVFNSIPVSILCKDDCKGLCPMCGTDLNTKKCECKQEVGDPRFAIFKDLLKGEV